MGRERLIPALERFLWEERREYLADKARVLASHLVFGILRGMGFALGFSIFSALAAVALRHLVVENIPLIGGFLAEVIHAIEERL